MSEGEQQSLFDLFAPAAGVHRAPPDSPAAAGSSPVGQAKIVFERSYRARHYRLTLRRDGTAGRHHDPGARISCCEAER